MDEHRALFKRLRWRAWFSWELVQAPQHRHAAECLAECPAHASLSTLPKPPPLDSLQIQHVAAPSMPVLAAKEDLYGGELRGRPVDGEQHTFALPHGEARWCFYARCKHSIVSAIRTSLLGAMHPMRMHTAHAFQLQGLSKDSKDFWALLRVHGNASAHSA